MLNIYFTEKLPLLKEIFVKHKVSRAFVFGSVNSDHFNSESDIDLLISLQENIDPIEAGEHFWGIYYDAKELFNREIDILSEKA